QQRKAFHDPVQPGRGTMPPPGGGILAASTTGNPAPSRVQKEDTCRVRAKEPLRVAANVSARGTLFLDTTRPETRETPRRNVPREARFSPLRTEESLAAWNQACLNQARKDQL